MLAIEWSGYKGNKLHYTAFSRPVGLSSLLAVFVLGQVQDKKS